MKNKILKLMTDINNLNEENRILDNVFYLNDTEILCSEYSKGDVRYPYEMDGLNLWAHSNGYINACESNLVIFRTASIQEEPSIDFWGSVKNGNCTMPLSVTGATKHMFEPNSISRYTVYSKRAAYYIMETVECIFALRVHVTSKKNICFTFSAINKANYDFDISMTSYIDPMVRFTNNEDPWALLKRYGWYDGKKSFKILRYPNPENQDVQNITNIAVVNRDVDCRSPYEIQSTVSKAVFLGERGRCLFNAVALKNGVFEKEVYSINTIDLPVVSDIISFNLKSGEEIKLTYLINVVHDECDADALMQNDIDLAWIENDFEEQEKKEAEGLANLKIRFGDLRNIPINNNVFNHFLKNVQKQVSFCALGKNYAGDLLGVRDVFQQLTATVLWNPGEAREKIVRALNFIMENGRPPRQFSVPPRDDIISTFDIREFIDQGLWIIETLHKYISCTGDFTILNENCSYYKIIDGKKAIYQKSNCTDSVLQHLLRITDYLISNIDNRTGCLKILYGDWNDAVCGLGESQSGDGFGSGVSVMATLQLYKALREMSEILEQVGGYETLCSEYAQFREGIEVGLEKYAIQKDGERNHIIHGWGDKGKYLVGSLCDTDGKCRYSVNPYSFWCISDMIYRNPSLKNDILQAYDVLDSKYGIKTFEPYFPKDMSGVGRIVDLTPGTYENSCAYIHATMFAVMALFELGEPERAWEQILKAIPLTHAKVSKTPFVMPNSYCFNEEYCIDGESAGDWYTGSGAVLMRCIIEHALGIQATVAGINIAVPSYLPADFVEITLTMKNSDITLIYRNTNSGKRVHKVNGVEISTVKDVVSGEQVFFIDNNDITEELKIEVID